MGARQQKERRPRVEGGGPNVQKIRLLSFQLALITQFRYLIVYLREWSMKQMVISHFSHSLEIVCVKDKDI